MAESTCLLHAFSYQSSISNEAQDVSLQDNPMYGMEESVSLGRFMTETLSWEKWSSFSRNRYVEEAEMYSRPGSVKQKKAYFEAHFKRMAALKAASLLEQANSTQVGAPDPPMLESHGHSSVQDQQWLEKEDEKLDGSDDEVFEETDQNEDDSNDVVIKEVDHNEELRECFMDVEEQKQCTEVECDLAAEEHESFIEEEDVFHECVGEKEESLAKASDENEQAVKSVNPSTEMETSFVTRDESHLECSSVNQDSIPLVTSPRSKPYATSAALIPSTPAMVPASGKENTFTPIGRKSWINDPDKKRTPLRMSINRELNRLISPVIKKIGSSSKTSAKDCTTPAKTSVNGMKNDPLETPQSGRRRRALFDSSAGGGGSKPSGSRWQFLSTEGSKSPARGRNKTSSPIIPKSFCLNGTRVPRRKESLEEKFNAKATETTQQQSKLKEKPNELTKLRHSFCFGAKLSSESFRERRENMEMQMEKKKGKDCKLPKKGGSRLQNMTSLPTRKSEPKGAKNAKSKEG